MMGTQDLLKPIRIGLLGAGYIADWHVKAIRRIKGLTITSVCDVSKSRANAVAESCGAPNVFTSLRDLAHSQEVDAVHVLLPPHLHYPAAIELLKAGKDVFVEKPMCLTGQQCDDLGALSTSLSRRFAVAHNFLFHRCFQELKNDLNVGRFGPLDQVVITWNKELGQLRNGPFDIWMLQSPENLLLEIGSHLFAYAVDILGEIQIDSISTGRFRTLPSGKQIPEHWTIIGYSRLTKLQIHISFVPAFTEHSVQVRGSFGSATANMENGTYLPVLHSAMPDDFDRYQMSQSCAKKLRWQSRSVIGDYLLSKARKKLHGSLYGESIGNAIQAFYRQSDVHRIHVQTAKKVIDLCIRAAELAELPKDVPNSLPSRINSKPTNSDVLLLGATGFIGQATVKELLNRGHQVRVLVRDSGKLDSNVHSPNLEVFVGNLENTADLQKAMEGCRTVIHLARANVKKWHEYQEKDIRISESVAKECIRSKVELLIYSGTIDSYFAGNPQDIIRETTPLDSGIAGRNLYARAKAETEELLLKMQRDSGLNVAIVRPGIVIGSGGSPFHWGIGMWYHSSVCHVWGRGQNPLPLVLVQDVATALANMVHRSDLQGASLNLIGDVRLSAQSYLQELELALKCQIQKKFVSPTTFYAKDMLKWAVKCVVRHPERRMPTLRDWNSRTQLARFDCEETKSKLNWSPITNVDQFIRLGIFDAAYWYLS